MLVLRGKKCGGKMRKQLCGKKRLRTIFLKRLRKNSLTLKKIVKRKCLKKMEKKLYPDRNAELS